MYYCSKSVDNVPEMMYHTRNALIAGIAMTARDIVSKACKVLGITMEEAANRIGWRKQQLNGRFVSNSLRLEDFLKMMDAIGVDVEFKVRETGEVIRPHATGMGGRVRCMVDKVIYDTNDADALANNFYADGVNKFTDGRAMELYIDEEGRYFFAEYAEWEGAKDRITPVPATVAADFIQKYGTIIQKEPNS